jgi:hypothetical protein
MSDREAYPRNRSSGTPEDRGDPGSAARYAIVADRRLWSEHDRGASMAVELRDFSWQRMIEAVQAVRE